jgi:inorganic pyrophosphatase
MTTPTADGDLPAVVEVRIEVAAGGFAQRAADGRVQRVSPLPCPFNYGSVPGTVAPDGDPFDAIVLGRALPSGHRSVWTVHGVVRFIDEGVEDPKLVCGPSPPTAADLARLRLFFDSYARLKSTWARMRGRPPCAHLGYESR